jgi:hypothetical protein
VKEGKMDRACRTKREKRNTYGLLVGKPEGRPRHRWMNKIKMDLGDVRWGGMDSIGLVQVRDKSRVVINAVMKL